MSDKVEIIRKGMPNHDNRWLVKKGEQYYIASGVIAFDHGGWEVLVFKSDKDGNIEDWSEVAGGRDYTHEEAIGEL